jgi:hypothetical protein
MTANSSSDRELGYLQQQQRPPWLTVSTLPRSMCNEHRNPADLLQRSTVAFYVLAGRCRWCVPPRALILLLQYRRTIKLKIKIRASCAIRVCGDKALKRAIIYDRIGEGKQAQL